jgi:hypothetical protein
MTAFIHGRVTVLKLSATDLSIYTNTSEVTEVYDEHDVTGYGAVGHAVQGGLQTGKVTFGGTYHSASTGPRKVIQPLLGTNVVFVRQPEGVGTTLPQDSATIHVKSYVETSPVADMVKWACEGTVSGIIDHTAQP